MGDRFRGERVGAAGERGWLREREGDTGQGGAWVTYSVERVGVLPPECCGTGAACASRFAAPRCM